jgi:hypothetical protein
MSFKYQINITGDCANNGNGGVQIDIISDPNGVSVEFNYTLPPYGLPSEFDNTTPPYTFEWVSPNLGIDYSLSSLTKTNLSSGNYSVNVYDSSIPSRNTDQIFFTISSGFTCNILNVSKTTCGLNNGGVTATTNTSFTTINYNIYTSNNDLVVTTTLPTYNFLSAGTYYIVAQDFGGCSARSESCIFVK